MDEYPGSLQRIPRALNDEDMQELEREAHSLKGAAGNVGGKATLDAALALEESAESGDLTKCRAVAKELEKECVALRNALEEYLGRDYGGQGRRED